MLCLLKSFFLYTPKAQKALPSHLTGCGTAGRDFDDHKEPGLLAGPTKGLIVTFAGLLFAETDSLTPIQKLYLQVCGKI